MIASLVISIAHILSKRNYFTAATMHGVGDASSGLIYTSISLGGSNRAQIVIIVLGLGIVTMPLGVFSKQFKTRSDAEIQEICLNKKNHGMTEVYRDKLSIKEGVS